jgi:hypothetical protein
MTWIADGMRGPIPLESPAFAEGRDSCTQGCETPRSGAMENPVGFSQWQERNHKPGRRMSVDLGLQPLRTGE